MIVMITNEADELSFFSFNGHTHPMRAVTLLLQNAMECLLILPRTEKFSKVKS